MLDNSESASKGCKRRSRVRWIIAVAGLAVLLVASNGLPASAVTVGSVSGYVLDPVGNPIANALLEAVDIQHGVKETARSDETGFYRFAGLNPGVWAVSIEIKGFEKVRKTDIQVFVGSRIRLDFHPPIAGMKESVEVTAKMNPLETKSGDLGMILDHKRIQGLPLNRRDFLQLALLTPGVAPPVEESELSARGGFAMHANGGREEYNNFLLDGIDNNDPYVNRYTLQPSLESIQEFRIETNNYSAEFNRSAAGQVNVITRRGSNQFHGYASEYLRNRVLDANNYFDAGEKNKHIRNQFGFGLGGPIVRDKTFFFGNVDFLKERIGLSRISTVPTDLQRQGNLSELSATIFDPFTHLPFPGKILPDARISPVARQLLGLYPRPTSSGISRNYIARPTQKEDLSLANIRVDHRFSDRDNLTVRYSYGRQDMYEAYSEDTASIPGFGDFVKDRTQNALIHYERILGPRTVSSLRAGFNRFARRLLSENARTDVGQLLGVDWLNVNPRSFGYPSITIAGWSKIGEGSNLPILRATNTFEISEALSLDRGKHLFKTGVQMRRLQLNSVLDLLVRGSLSFSGALSGSGVSDFLLGYPSFALRAEADNPMTLRSTSLGAYFQDEWQLSPRLTLTLGLRYEYDTPPIDPTNRMSTLNWTTESIVPVGTNGVSRSGLKPDRNNLAPRVGFAWSLNSRTVLRGGYGLYFDSGMLEVNTAQYFNPPRFNMRVYFPSMQGLLTLQNPFPVTNGYTPPPSLNILSPDIVTSYMQHWNLDVQQSLGAIGTLSVAYAGSRGVHLIRSRDRNQPAPAEGSLQPRRPLPAFGSILLVESGSNSSYHSLQMSFRRPAAAGISIWAAYTLSKSIDDTSAFLGSKTDTNFPQNSRNIRAERGLSSFDVRHRLALSYVYELPRGNRWTRDMEFRGITTLQSGQPFTPILRFDNSNTGNTGQGSGYDRPNLLRNPRLSIRTPERWFDVEAFAIPEPYTFGNSGRNILRGPGFATFDVSLMRQMSLSEQLRLTLETQVFNVFNRTNFDIPELYVDDPGTFGRILSAKAPRQMQFAVRLSF
jgi:hypothetical protein